MIILIQFITAILCAFLQCWIDFFNFVVDALSNNS